MATAEVRAITDQDRLRAKYVALWKKLGPGRRIELQEQLRNIPGADPLIVEIDDLLGARDASYVRGTGRFELYTLVSGGFVRTGKSETGQFFYELATEEPAADTRSLVEREQASIDAQRRLDERFREIEYQNAKRFREQEQEITDAPKRAELGRLLRHPEVAALLRSIVSQ